MTQRSGIGAYLRDHKVKGVPVLPGALAVELALASAEKSRGAPLHHLRRVTFLSPLRAPPGSDVRMRVEVQPRNGELDLRLLGANGTGEWIEHMTAAAREGAPPAPAWGDLAGIQARCTDRGIMVDALYGFFARLGLEYGHRFQVIRSLARGPEEVLAELTLPAGLEEEAAGYRLHPSLLDGALQTLGGMAIGAVEPSGALPLYLPFAIDEIVIHAPARESILVHGRIGMNGSGNADLLKGEATLMDRSGRVLVELRGISVRRVRVPGQGPAVEPRNGLRSPPGGTTTGQPPPEPSPTRSTPEPPAGWLHEVAWERRDLPMGAEPRVPGHSWIFADDQGIGAALAARLRTRGGQVVLIRRGGAFQRLGEDELVLAPADPGGYTALFEALGAKPPPEVIFHLWACGRPGAAETLGELEARVFDPTASLLCLLQARTRRRGAPEVELCVAVTDAHGVEGVPGPSSPEGAAVAGLLKVVSLEFPSVHCRCVDLPSSSEPLDVLAERLLQELGAKEREVVHRGGARWVPELRQLTPGRFRARTTPLRQGGRYLITGGLGGLGLSLARWLAEGWRARLVLTSRTALPDRARWTEYLAGASAEDPRGRQLRELMALEELGAEILLLQADAADVAAMAEVVSRAKARFGGLDGIFHAAGLLRDGLLARKELESLREVLRPKAHGAWVLDRVTRDEPLQLMVLFSSIVSLSGNIGQGDYAAANRYLDAFAAWRSAQGRPTLSIDWGPWAEVGMAAGLGERVKSVGLELLEPRLALKALEAALCSERSQIVVAGFSGAARPPVEAPTRPAVSGRAAPAAEEIEQVLLAKLSTLLKIAPEYLDPETNFLDYGMDSIMGAKLVRELEEKLQDRLNPALLLELPNVRALSRYFTEKMDPAVVARLLELPGADAADPPPAVAPPTNAEAAPEQPPAARITATPEVTPPPSHPPSPPLAPPPEPPRNGVEARSERGAVPVLEVPVPSPRPAQTSARVTPKSGGDIAVVGYAGRFPGAPSAEDFWELLRAGRSAIREVPPDRWSPADFYDPDPAAPGKTYSKWGAFLDGIDRFDPLFFTISPREAERMDPQQRLLLETSWEALEMAGLAGKRLSGTETGIFVGGCPSGYLGNFLNDRRHIDGYVGTGNSASVMANRLSYLLNLKGPSLTVDTACSSALVALHLAMESLLRGESQVALAAGVNLLLGPELYIAFSKGMLLSREGVCRPLDERGDGYVRGEGVGCVVLKPLEAALRDGDAIHAVIKGTAVNHDGRTNGLVAPNGEAQRDVLRKAYARAGIAPSTVSYVEAHASAHAMADRIELEALGEILGEERAHPCAIGSLKGNIGHLEMASGMAALLKVILALRSRQLPPTLHHERLPEDVRLDPGAFRVVNRLEPWTGPGPLRAGISSFGFGGANAHVVLEEPPRPPPATSDAERPVHLLTLSGRTEQGARELASRFAAHLTAHPEQALVDVCATANRGRAHLPHRLTVLASSAGQVAAELESYARGQPAPAVRSARVRGSRRPRVAFLFTGQGSQYAGMGQQLYRTERVFRKALDRCAELLRPRLARPLLDLLFQPAVGASPLDDTCHTQPALFAIEYAIAELWRSWGVEPVAVLGHSVGELPAACIAGILSLEEGLALAAERGRLLQSLPRNGRMAAVLADEERVAAALAPVRDRVAIAALNGPAHTVISGEAPAVEALCSGFESEGLVVRPLNVSHAFHSPLVEPVAAPLRELAATLQLRDPSIAFVSNLYGRTLAVGERLDGEYWVRHMREPVRFASGMAALAALGCDAFFEVGPDPILLGLGKRSLTTEGALWLPSMRRGVPDLKTTLESAGQLYLRGVELRWDAIGGEGRRTVALPTSPFERRRCWIDASPPPPVPPAPSTPRVSTPAPLAPERRETGARRTSLEAVLRAEVGKLLNLAPEEVNPDQPLEAQGFDSLLAIELKAALERRVGRELPVEELADSTSIADLVELGLDPSGPLAGLVRLEEQAPTSAATTTTSAADEPLRSREASDLPEDTGRPVLDPGAYGRHMRPALATLFAAVNLDKAYVWARGDRMAFEEGGRRVEVLDFVGGYGATLFGHNHPELVSRARENLARAVPAQAQGSIRGYAGMLAEALSRRLGASTGRRYLTVLPSTGAEAIEAAIRHASIEHQARAIAEQTRIRKALALLVHQGRGEQADLPPALRERWRALLGGEPPRDLRAAEAALAAWNERVMGAEPLFLALGRSFHGKTLGAQGLTANQDPLAKAYRAGLRIRWLPPGDAATLERTLEEHTTSAYTLARENGELSLVPRPWCAVAALFVEPVQGEGGVHPLEPAFAARLREAADRHGFPLVLDEIQTGLGRCGAFTASERLGLRGDYYTFGKSLGGGVAKIAALAVDAERYEPSFGLSYAATFADDEPSALVALRALELVERDRLPERCEALGRRMLERFRELQRRYPDVVADVRGMGCLVGVELVDPSSSPSALLRTVSEQLGFVVAGYLLNEERIRVLPTGSSPRTMRLEPSAYMAEADVERCLQAFERLCEVFRSANGARLVRHLVPGLTLDPLAPIADWRERHPAQVSGGTTAERKVAFLTYFVEPDDLTWWEPSLAELPAGACEAILGRFHRPAGPRVLRQVEIRSGNGEELGLTMIGLLVTSRIIEDAIRSGETTWLLERIDEAVDLARREGCQVAGFGGLLSVVTHNCKKAVTSDLALTTGNALTVAMGVEGIRAGCLEQGIELARARMGVVGATGNISSTYTRIIAQDVARLVLVGRKSSMPRLRALASQLLEDAWWRTVTLPEAELTGLARAIARTGTVRTWQDAPEPPKGEELLADLERELGPEAPVQLTEELASLTTCDVILTASNSASPVIFPEHLAPGPVVICDIAVPPDVSPEVVARRPDVRVIDGGAVKLPAQAELDLCGRHQPRGHVFACMAETLLLGLEGQRGHFSFGAIEPDDVERIMEMARRHGFERGRVWRTPADAAGEVPA